MRSVRRLLEVVLFFSLSFPVAVMPRRVALKVGGTLGLLLFHLWGSRSRIAADNIGKAIGAGALEASEPPEAIAKKSFINLGKSFVEIAKIYYGLGRGIIDNVEVRGREHYLKAKAKGRGVIFITGHCGNWELMAISFGVKFDRISSIARPQNNPYMNTIIERARSRYGNGIIYKKGALKDVLSELRKNGVIGILMDQAVVREEGYVLEFLGRGAWTTKMPALIARKTGAAVLPAFINREGDRHVVCFYPEIQLARDEDNEKAVIEDTKRFSGFIEDYIKQHPSEWLWIHRRWKRVEPSSFDTGEIDS